MVRCLFVLLLLAGSVCAETFTITSLPYTFASGDHSADDTDTLVIDGARLNATGNAITISADDVLLNLGTDTVVYGTDGGNSYEGITLNYVSDVEVRGGYVLHSTAATTADGCEGFHMRGDNLLLTDVVADVRGYNGHVVAGGGSSVHTHEIDGGTFTNHCTAFDSRCDYDACVIKYDHLYSSTLGSNDYHLYVHDVTIPDGPHVGITAQAYGSGDDTAVVWIDSCTITTDARNSFYTSYDGLCHSTSNPYAIALLRTGRDSRIIGNTIRSGTSHGGNRGILVEYAWATGSDTMEITGNDVDVHEGPNVEYGDNLPSHGLRIRYQPNNILVENNTFICRGDSASATDDYGVSIHPVRLSTNISATDVTIQNNTIQAISNSAAGVNCNGVTFDGIDYADTYTLRDNNITSPGTIYKFGDVGSQDVGPTGVTIIGDTIAFAGTTINPYTFYLGHLSNNWDCQDNIACDIVYQGSTAYDDITFASAGTCDITIQKTCSLFVGSSIGEGLPIVNATCSLWNDYGDLIVSGTTDSSGCVSGVAAYRFESRTMTDSTAYNDFTFKAVSGESSTSNTSFTVAHNDGNDTLWFAITGTGDWDYGEEAEAITPIQCSGSVTLSGGVQIQ